MTIRSYEENLTTSAEDYGDGLMLKAHVARDMVREFDGKDLDGVSVQVEAGKKYRVRRSMEAMNNPTTLASFASAPVLLGHKPIGQYSVSEEMVGFPIGSPHKASEAMLSIEYRLTDPVAIKAYRDGKAVELSPAYDFDLVPAPNGADYDFTMTDVVVDHVAQVERGKNGPTARLYEEEDMELSKDQLDTLANLVVAKLGGDKDKPTTAEFLPEGMVSQADADAKLDAYKAMVNDQKLVQPLLENDRARSAIEKATTSVEVLAIALGMKRDLAEAAGEATLRGQAMERIKIKAEQAKEQMIPDETETTATTAESWENLNAPDGTSTPRKARTQEAFSPLFKALEDRAQNVRAGKLGMVIGTEA